MKLTSPDEEKALRTIIGAATRTAPAAPAFSAARRPSKRAAAAALWSIFFILTVLLFPPGPCAHGKSCSTTEVTHGASSYQRIMTISLQRDNGGLSPYPIGVPRLASRT